MGKDVHQTQLNSQSIRYQIFPNQEYEHVLNNRIGKLGNIYFTRSLKKDSSADL